MIKHDRASSEPQLTDTLTNCTYGSRLSATVVALEKGTYVTQSVTHTLAWYVTELFLYDACVQGTSCYVRVHCVSIHQVRDKVEPLSTCL